MFHPDVSLHMLKRLDELILSEAPPTRLSTSTGRAKATGLWRTDVYGQNCLHHAAREGHWEIVEWLL